MYAYKLTTDNLHYCTGMKILKVQYTPLKISPRIFSWPKNVHFLENFHKEN